ncbi:MAG: E2/UBC family protein [bacterium]
MNRFGSGSYTLTSEANMMCLVIQGYNLPMGFDCERSDILLRLQSGYPDLPPDMWWFNPSIHRVDGKPIPQTEVIEHYLGRVWQRWSRHIPPKQWLSGVDSLESYFALIYKELEKSVMRSVP